jgi:hypothetical protein
MKYVLVILDASRNGATASRHFPMPDNPDSTANWHRISRQLDRMAACAGGEKMAAWIALENLAGAKHEPEEGARPTISINHVFIGTYRL